MESKLRSKSPATKKALTLNQPEGGPTGAGPYRFGAIDVGQGRTDRTRHSGLGPATRGCHSGLPPVACSLMLDNLPDHYASLIDSLNASISEESILSPSENEASFESFPLEYIV